MPGTQNIAAGIIDMMRGRAGELLRNGSVSRVLGWENGEFYYDQTPAVFYSESELGGLVYNGFSSAMLSKYLVGALKNTKEHGKILVFLKPCDTYGLNLQLKEHRVAREKIYAVGVGCFGMLDMEKIKAGGVKLIKSIDEKGFGDNLVVHAQSGEHTFARRDVLLEKCLSCKGGEFMVQDEVLAPEGLFSVKTVEDRFAGVIELEAMSPEERFTFWRGELSKCIRCNACRNTCPVCSCNNCVFDNPRSGVQSKSNANSFEENMFHIVRAFHVAGRCSDCGECSRVCPQRIPLHLLNRKFIRDINTFYGEFQSGADIDTKSPLTDYRLNDIEPGAVRPSGAKGGKS
jgi:ferredoxin